MFGYIIDVLIWSFAIYGFLNFIKEFWLDMLCYIVEKCVTLVIFFKKFVAKFCR